MNNFPTFVMTMVVVLVLGAVGLGDEVRIWTDDTGEHETKAEFVSYDDGVVTLRRPGSDKLAKIPLERLSDEDQEYVDDLLRELEEAEDAEEDGSAEPKVVTRPESNEPSTTQRRSPRSGKTAARRPANNMINSVRGAVYRTQALNSMKQISLAILQYESSRGRFPSAAIRTADDKPGLSWRVAILPMIDENNLYRQFKLNEPWDSDHNKAMITRMPSLFQSPGSDLDGGYTNYLAVVSPDTIISSNSRGTKVRDIRDGTSHTVMLVEADDTYAAIWTKPDDYDWDESQPAYGLGGIWSGTFFVGYGDGSVARLDSSIGAQQLNAYFSRNGGESIR